MITFTANLPTCLANLKGNNVSQTDIAMLKAAGRAAIDSQRAALRTLSDAIHDHPELAHEEIFAHEVLTRFLDERGFDVVRHAHGLATAFRGARGSGSPVIAFLCEYDALPEIGHGCGHNLVAAAGIAGAIGAAAVLEEVIGGTVIVIGTPAEERFGGKADLIEDGAFEEVDVAMMAHTSRADIARPATSAHHGLTITYRGRPAHAAGAPWGGINALDALVAAYTSIGLMRQQLPSDVRVQMIITHGGEAPNIIPDRAEALCIIRAPNAARLAELRKRVQGCLDGAAQATGCALEVGWAENPYLDLVSSAPVAARYVENMATLGVKVEAEPVPRAGSTDMGNVSQVVPAIQPIFVVPGDVPNHTPEFAVLAGTDAAFEVTMQAGTGLAWTAIDLMTDAALLHDARAEFRARGSTAST